MQSAMDGDLDEVVHILAENPWPWRQDATYDETIARARCVLNWFFDHAETISDRSIDRIAVLKDGVAVQHRMASRRNISLNAMAMRQQRRRRW
jgi:predicted amidohydrolase YtcJ